MSTPRNGTLNTSPQSSGVIWKKGVNLLNRSQISDLAHRALGNSKPSPLRTYLIDKAQDELKSKGYLTLDRMKQFKEQFWNE